MLPSPQVTLCHAGAELRDLQGAAYYARLYSQDGVVYDHVVCENEYRLPDRFLKTDLVIDIGANIGFFTMACLARGARRVECYEQDPDNFELLEKNLKHRKVELYPHAVGRSDRKENLKIARVSNGLTAMGITLHTSGQPIPSKGLDQILSRHKEVRLLKLDCEGSEYAAVMTASPKQLRKCRVICGELHTAFIRKLVPWEWNSEAFCRKLEKSGFEVAVVPNEEAPTIISNFWAFRKESD